MGLSDLDSTSVICVRPDFQSKVLQIRLRLQHQSHDILQAPTVFGFDNIM